MGDLKPCPFCGGKATLLSEELRLFPVWWVQCAQRPHPHHTNCFQSEAEAIAAWNRRATPPEVTALVEAATALRDQIARWHAGGPAAGPDESRSLFEVLDEAITEWEAANA